MNYLEKFEKIDHRLIILAIKILQERKPKVMLTQKDLHFILDKITELKNKGKSNDEIKALL